jgi:hypothetical protein
VSNAPGGGWAAGRGLGVYFVQHEHPQVQAPVSQHEQPQPQLQPLPGVKQLAILEIRFFMETP